VAIGKAAAAMLQGALDSSSSIRQSLLICPPSKITRQLKKNKNITCLASSHPVPDEKSLEAGQALIRFLSGLDVSDELLFLISGGTSALVEVPITGVTLEQLQAINHYLLASGKDIYQVNAWRQKFSSIKGGGLLNSIKQSAVTQLLLSDVKHDRVEVIGSGLLVQTSVQPEQDDYLESLIAADKTALKTIQSDVEVTSHIIGNIKLAMQAVHQAAQAQGLDSFLHEQFLEGEAVNVADDLYKQLQEAAPGIHIWGGETTVTLPENPGVGGRNQTLALAFAQRLVDQPGLHLLAAGTDGIDGNSNCAGAVVSMYTAEKASKMGFDIEAEIEKANAGLLLMASDDLVSANNSNTNVMDIVIAYKIS
jgi:hydroxypyruvate reductase